MRKWVLAALVSSVALAGCGASGDAPPTTPVTFTLTVTTPTSTIPTPTRTSYVGPNGMPIQTGPFLGVATTTQPGSLVDGIQCMSLAQLAYTAYAHLQVYVDGKPRALPGGIGLVGGIAQVTSRGLLFSAHTCMYWLHTRAADGVIEMQSPIHRDYTLGDFFRIWNQPLSTKRVATARGTVTATVNGRRWRRDPTAIPLREHTEIQLAVGRPVPAPQAVDWTASGL